MSIKQSDMTSGFILTIISSIAYGMVSILLKLAYNSGMQAMDIFLARYVFATAFILIFTLANKRQILPIKKAAILIIICLGIILGVQNILFFESLKYIPVSTAVLIVYLNPVIVTLFFSLFLKKRMSKLFITALVLVTAGSTLIFFDAFTRNLSILGLGLAVVTLILSAIYVIWIEKVVQQENALSITFYIFLFTGLFFCLLGKPENLLYLQGNQLILTLSLGLFPTAISGLLFYMAIERIGATYSSLFSSFEPVYSLIAAHFFLGEDIFSYQLAGAACIIIGIILPNLKLNQL